MTEKQTSRLEPRLYGMMQSLMGADADRETPPSAPERGAVQEQDALNAVMQAAAVIDEFTQSGAIPQGRSVHAGAMLMVVRDYVKSLPAGPDTEGHDDVTDALHELVGVLRQAHEEFGHQD